MLVISLFFLEDQMKKAIIPCCIVLASLLVIYFLQDEKPLEFAHWPYEERWEISSSQSNESEKKYIHQILDQPFSYLDEGGQSYAFVSQDGRYVLKLFKERLTPSLFVRIWPSIAFIDHYRNKHLAKREKKHLNAFIGHKLAYETIRQESALIYVQLNPSKESHLVTITDRNKRPFAVDLKGLSFVIQEKGTMLKDALADLFSKGDIAGVERRIGQLFSLYLGEYAKGIYDLDRGIMHNIGCLEDRVFHLDVGKMVSDERIKEEAFYREDLAKMATKLKTWIHRRYPQHSSHFSDLIEQQSHLMSQ